MDHRNRPGLAGRFIATLVMLAALSLPVAAAPVKLKVGLMPAVDAAPMLLAAERGYFAAEGVEVELIVFPSANERQVALQTGAVDGTITDLVAFVYNVQGGFDLRIASSTDGAFPFLVRKGFVETRSVRVAMMEVSVSNYLADAWLAGRYEIEKIFITEIPARLEMIKAGKIDMACLPEPIASMGQLAGLEKREFENPDGYYPDILAFTAKAAAEKLDAIRRFNRAVDRAVADLAKDPELARRLLVVKLKLDPRVESLMTLPTWHATRMPGDAYLAKVSAWIAGLQGKPVALDWSKYLLREALP
ncbi:MAG: ABC transporter substrate-binding protein [Spirochaetia bacterium]|nr:ABC transporter substrate-binding protein [Spirochaetia bacterium]